MHAFGGPIRVANFNSTGHPPVEEPPLPQKSLNPAKLGRIASQLLFLGLTLWTAQRMIAGVRGATIEKYCPFGGVETIIPWITKTGTLCSLSTLNLSMLGGVLVITLLFKRAFCSHICPVGTLAEWISALGRRLHLRVAIPRGWDQGLRWVKYAGLIAIVYFTFRVQELIFREVDPFYVLFTLGQGHGIAEGPIGVGRLSLAIVLALLLAGIVLPLLFCRFLCPFAAFLTPFSRLGLTRIRRDEAKCTKCGRCDKACDWKVRVSTARSVTDGECSNCQECLHACPVPGALTLGIGPAKTQPLAPAPQATEGGQP
jgi:polyferredoxin